MLQKEYQHDVKIFMLAFTEMDVREYNLSSSSMSARRRTFIFSIDPFRGMRDCHKISVVALYCTMLLILLCIYNKNIMYINLVGFYLHRNTLSHNIYNSASTIFYGKC